MPGRRDVQKKQNMVIITTSNLYERIGVVLGKSVILEDNTNENDH